MTASIAKREDLNAGIVSRRASRLLALRIVLCLVAIWAIFGMIVFETRRDAWSDAKRFGADVATLVETAIAREIEVYDLSLAALAKNSSDPDILALPPALKQKTLFDQSAEASDLGRLLVLDRNGRVIESSHDRSSIGLDLSDREYFRAQKSGVSAALRLDGPLVSRITHVPSMVISRRRSTADGSFIGIAVGTIQLAFFERLFTSVHLPQGSTITLLKRDGTIMTRAPTGEKYLGRKVMNDILADALVQDAGTYHRVSGTDGIERLFAFRRIGTLPLYVSVGLSTDEIFANSRWEILVIGTGFAFLSALILLLGVNLAAELRRRGRAEHRLAELASTDYLTRLANRRRFDEVLAAEWRRGARAGSPLSLLMVDGDFFKSFNDTYGHLEGDRVLRTIAAALQTCVDRSGDLVARYGGEEFAVLLPLTGSDGALIVAEAIRASIDALDLVHATTPSGRLTVSIGIACRTPETSVASETLVEAADAALYLAKGEGRDRVVMADRPMLRSDAPERRVA